MSVLQSIAALSSTVPAEADLIRKTISGSVLVVAATLKRAPTLTTLIVSSAATAAGVAARVNSEISSKSFAAIKVVASSGVVSSTSW